MNERTKIQITLENGLDGRLFAQQRALIIQLMEQAQSGKKRELLEGMTNFLDVVADQAYDNYGIDCLLTSTEQDSHDSPSVRPILTEDEIPVDTHNFGYIAVNLSKTEASWPDEKWYYVLPGESPHTYTKLESAAAQVAERMQEDGHTWDTIAIFELYRVDSGRLEPLVQLALKKSEADADIL